MPSDSLSSSGTAPAAVPCPVTSVTLLEDRAEIRRLVPLDLAAGTHRVRLGPVTPLAVDRSLRAELDTGAAGGGTTDGGGAGGGTTDGGGEDAGRDAAAATVVDVRLVRLWTPPPLGAPGEDASALRRRVHELTEAVRRLDADRERTASRVAVLDQLLAELHRDIAESTGAGEADPERWTADLDRAYREHGLHTEALRLLDRRLVQDHDQLRQAERALEETEEQPPVLSAFVDVVIEAAAPCAAAELTLHHLVPCALWRPAHRAELSVDGSSLSLQQDAVVWQRTGEDWSGVEAVLSTARTTQAAEPPRLGEDVLLLVDRTPEERRTVEVDLREVEIQTVGPADDADADADGYDAALGGPSDAALSLPGVDDGGEVRVLAVPAPLTVPSDGRPHRVRLGADVLPVRAEYRAAPELSSLVSQVVRFRNGTGQVLLSGPVDLVRGSGFVGRGELRFTAVDAPAELSFGSDDTFRITRAVEESRDSTALTGRTVLTRTVRLSVSRFAPPGSAPLEVAVRERIPVSELAAVEVRLDKDRCSPPPDEVDAEGVVRYALTLGADDRRTLTLGYEISAARSVAL